MPVDPTTGEELPYPGQPGYEEAKKKNPEAYAAEEGGDAGEGQSVMDVANRLDELAGAEAGEAEAEEEAVIEEGAEEAAEEEVAEEEAVAAEGDDLSPLMDTLGATEERAQILYDAAQKLAKTEGKTPQELADMIADDFDVLMQLEMIASRDEGGAMGGLGEAAPAEAAMPPMTEGMEQA